MRNAHMHMGQRGTRVSTTIQPNTTRRVHGNTNQNANRDTDTSTHLLAAVPDNDGPHYYMRNAHMHMGQRDTRVSTTIKPNTQRRAQQHKPKRQPSHTHIHTHTYSLQRRTTTTHIIICETHTCTWGNGARA